jgi:hypothetical protein
MTQGKKNRPMTIDLVDDGKLPLPFSGPPAYAVLSQNSL